MNRKRHSIHVVAVPNRFIGLLYVGRQILVSAWARLFRNRRAGPAGGGHRRPDKPVMPLRRAACHWYFSHPPDSPDRLVLCWGEPIVVTGSVEGRQYLKLGFEVRGGRSEQALAVFLQYLDADLRPLPGNGPGWQPAVDSGACRCLPAAPEGGRIRFLLAPPAAAGQVRLRIGPAAGRGELTVITELIAAEPPAAILSLASRPAADKRVLLALRLTAAVQATRACILVPEYFSATSVELPPPYPEFLSSRGYPAYRFLHAAMQGYVNQLAVTVPDGVDFCRFHVLPWTVKSDLRVEMAEADREEGRSAGFVPLPAEGLELHRHPPENGPLRFDLNVIAPAACDRACCLELEFRDGEGRVVPSGAAAGAAADGDGGRMLLGSEARSPGRLHHVEVPVPDRADSIGLRLVPLLPGAVRIRLEAAGQAMSRSPL